MRLKILIVPFLVVMILVLGIGYIKPDLETIQLKKAEVVAKNALVANIDTVLANIGSLNKSLDEARDSEKFAYRYLPETLDQDRVIDAFNFLATQSGLVITEMDLKQPPAAIREEALLTPAESTFVTGANAAPGSAPTIVPVVTAKTFILTGSVRGSYENIKAFFDRLAHIERFQKVRLFSIGIDAQSVSPEGVVNTSDLKGTFAADFGYLPTKPVISALDIPIFSRSNFDLSGLNTLTSRITDAVPVLEKGQTGKPNPFQ
ncbi:MAG: hypothetical protein WAW00_02805 [Candidatus Moraniibacteriota bacterium]